MGIVSACSPNLFPYREIESVVAAREQFWKRALAQYLMGLTYPLKVGRRSP
jgi:hypothetical protein